MRLNAQRTYGAIFIIVLLLQLYLPSFKVNIILQLFTVGLLVILGSTAASKKFLSHYLTITFLLVFGFAGTLLHKYDAVSISKDIFHFLKPVVGILIGYLVFRKVNDLYLFVKIIVVAALLSALIHFFILFFIVDISAGSLTEIRLFTRDNFLELFALFFIYYHKRFFSRPMFSGRYATYIVAAIITFSAILYFSRTMIIMAALLALTLYGYTRITKRTVILAFVGIIAVAGLYTYLYNANIRRGKPGLEGFLYKVKMAPEEIFTTRINRDDHRDLWDHWRGYEAARAYELMERNPSSFVVGTGHGSLIDLKFFAPLTGDDKGMRFISEIHNGYMYVFYKTGTIGLLVYLFMLFRWYFYLYKRKSFPNSYISAIGVIYIFSTMTITGLYNARDVIIFMLGGLLYFSHSQSRQDNLKLQHEVQ